MENQEERKKDNNKIYLLIAVIVALLGTNAYLFFQKNKSDERVVTVSDERTALQTELEKMETELEQVNNSSAKMTEELKAKDEEIKAKIADLRKALASGKLTANQLTKAKEDVKQLRYFVTKYTSDIEELQKQNAVLTTQRDSLQTTVTTVTQKATDLEKQNQDLNSKVQVGAALKTSGISVTPLKVKSSGKEKDVTRASTTKKVRISFSIVPNALATKGTHDVFIRILDPSGNLISGESGMFNADGQELQYTYKTAIEYNEDGKAYNVDWTNPAAFTKGAYTVLLYADGYSMGRGSFTLR